MEYEFSVDGKEYTLQLEKKGDEFLVRIGDRKLQVQSLRLNDNTCTFELNNKIYTAYFVRDEGNFHVSIGGENYNIEDLLSSNDKQRVAAQTDVHASGEICAPMPGRVLKIMVKEGQKVKKDQALFIVEAMKMEHSISAPGEGKVKKVNFKVNDLVDTGQPIVELELAKE